jgi:hypothetical protein
MPPSRQLTTKSTRPLCSECECVHTSGMHLGTIAQAISCFARVRALSPDHLWANRDGIRPAHNRREKHDVFAPRLHRGWQVAGYEADAWEETIREYLDKQTQVTIGQVARDALGIETPRIGTADQRRIAAALEQIGWRRCPKDWKGTRWWAKA